MSASQGNLPSPSPAQDTAEVWDFDEGDLSIYMMDDGSPVFLFGIHERCDDREVPWNAIVAKTRIAAAAPELLSALRETQMLLTFALLSTTAEIAAEARPFLDRARAAIAKATGAV